MTYEWDPVKARTNIRKHGIDFADAATVFSDDNARTIPDEYPDEERFVTLGMDALGRILVVVFTWRGHTFGLSRRGKLKVTRENNTKVK